jgi:hypothetical protein
MDYVTAAFRARYNATVIGNTSVASRSVLRNLEAKCNMSLAPSCIVLGKK